MKIVCVVPTLGHGGAQKVLLTIARYLDRDEALDVHILVFGNTKGNFYCTESLVVRSLGTIDVKLTSTGILATILKSTRYLKDQSPDRVLVFMDIANFPLLLASLTCRSLKVVVCERQDPSYYRICLLYTSPSPRD